MHRIYQREGNTYIAYEQTACSVCGVVCLCRMSDNAHYPWMCLDCTVKWWGGGRDFAVAIFQAALVEWCMTLLPKRTLQ